MNSATNDLEEALTFSVKHQQHTGHSLVWKRNELVDELISVPKRDRWRIHCETCGLERIFQEKVRAERFYDEHETYAGHYPQQPEHIELPECSAPDSSDVIEVIEHCFEKAETVDVVPTEAIIAAFEEEGIDRRRIVKELERVEAKTDVFHVGGGLLAR